MKMVVSIISRAMMVIFLPQSAFGSLDHRIVRSAEVLASLRRKSQMLSTDRCYR